METQRGEIFTALDIPTSKLTSQHAGKPTSRQASTQHRRVRSSKGRAHRAMTAVDLVHPKDKRDELNCSPRSPPLTSIGSNSRKRPRTSSSSTLRSFTAARPVLPPYPPHSKSSNDNGNDNDNGLESTAAVELGLTRPQTCLLYTSPSPRDGLLSRMPSSA